MSSKKEEPSQATDGQELEQMTSTTAELQKGACAPHQDQSLAVLEKDSETREDADASESEEESEEDETNVSEEKKALLKEKVVQSFSAIPSETFLRLRKELMALKEQNEYDQVTTVCPKTARLMERVFCRKSPK